MVTMRNTTRLSVLLIVILAASVSPALAYPPDNAAVLYYKAFILYQSPGDLGVNLWDYWKGNVESNEQVEKFLKQNRRIIDTVLDATRIEHCNWGLDYSRGTGVLLPPHHKAREIFVLLAVDARMQSDRGDYRKALGRCMSIYRMARHLNERPLMTYIIGSAIYAATNKLMVGLLSEMPQDIETLTWLKDQLAQFDKQPYSLEPILRWKREGGIISMSSDKARDVVQVGLDDGDLKQRILKRLDSADEQFFARNVAYWSQYMDAVQAAFALPYPERYAKLKQLEEKVSEEHRENEAATLTAALAPPWPKICRISTRMETHSNALRAAVELYIIKARTGSLPDSLPADLPGDFFSDKPFQYSKTANGFTLRCQGKDLGRDETYEYEFKIKR